MLAAALPFLHRTEVLLYPCVVILVVNVLLIFLKVNLTNWFVSFLI